jgi:hypothetical protein
MKNKVVLGLLFIMFFANFSFSARTQTHRLGFKGGFFYPAEHADVSGLEMELHFDAVIHDHVDAGPHFGLFVKNVDGSNLSSTENSKFLVVPITFQFRFYPLYSKEGGATHGVLAPYLGVSAGYYFALLYDSESLDVSQAPDGLGGFGYNACVGVEFGVGPNTSYFIEASYRLAKLESMRGYQLDLGGITLSLGARF